MESGWTIQVTYGSPSAGGAWTLSECADVCRAVAAADLNGDGVDEFVLEVDRGASTSTVQILALPFVPTGPEQVLVKPLHGGPGASARFPLGGSVAHQAFLTCDATGETPMVISTTADLDEQQTEYEVTETVMSVETDDGSRTGYPIVQALIVESTASSTVGFDPNGTEIPVRGTPCWDEG